MAYDTAVGYNVQYNDNYKLDAFYIWYANGRPTIKSLQLLLPPRPNNTRPGHATLTNWMKEWEPLADKMDAIVNRRIQKDMILRRIEMLRRHAEIGKTLQEKGLDQVSSVDFKFDKSADALRAIGMGVEIERESSGISDLLEKLHDADDQDILHRAVRLLNKVDADKIIDIADMEADDDSDLSE